MFNRGRKSCLNDKRVRDSRFEGKSYVFILLTLGILITFSSIAIGQGLGTFYYPPGNMPPGPPPNYNQIDTSYFMGTPPIPYPPPDSGGIYIWVDSTGWNIANHIYSKGNSLEQFHGSVLAMLDSPPEMGVNVFADGFEIFDDTTANKCYLQNDRWGWYQWSENLYEIWWDVSTREWKHGSGDVNDFMRINITGCAIDFNVWSSGHEGGFGLDQVFLGENMITLDNIPGFVDTYPGIDDPYQSQAGNDPTSDPNITIFAEMIGNGYSYNKYGVINAGDTYPCGTVLGEDYGDRFGNAFVYEGNGIQFSSLCQSDPCALNEPPVAVSPNDSTIFQCELTDICLTGFSYTDPDDNVLSVDLFGGTIVSESVCFTPVEGLNTITMIVTDECGEADTAVTIITVELNESPVADSPADSIIFLCQLDQICLNGFIYSDADNNIESVVVSNGVINGNDLCFTPVEGLNNITMIVTDECGEADTAVTNITVELNESPVADSPADSTMFLCQLEEICLDGFTFSDSDNNIVSVIVSNGTLNDGTVCLTPVEGLNTISLIVTDDCGEADTAVANITVELNNPPIANSPADSTIFQCQTEQICLDGFTYSDLDYNVVSVEISSGILNGETVCFTPVEGLNSLIFIVTDECGVADTAITYITVNINNSPAANSPADTTMFQCQLSEICLDGFTYTDIDDNITSVNVLNGTLNDGTVCFTPVEGLNAITLIVTDDCGVADTAVTEVTVNLNTPPSVSGLDAVDVFICGGESVCVDGYTYSDPDNNIQSIQAIGGTYDNGSICFVPVPGENTISLIVTDECGAADTISTTVTASNNAPPTADSPNDTTMLVCDNSEICLDGFVYNDPDDNINTVEVTGGTLNGNTVCFTPVSGNNVITLTVTDECGETTQTTTNIDVTFNSSPQAACPGDTSVLFICEVNEVCVGPFNSTDIDSNIDSAYVVTDGFSGNFDGSTFCFTPTMRAIYEIKYIVVDECGEADTCTVSVDAVLTNESPYVNCIADTSIIACDNSDICLTGFGYGDPDNNINDVQIAGGTYENGIICFTPVDGNNQITMSVTDECGMTAVCTTNVNVSFNSPPTVSCFSDTVMVMSAVDEICLPVTIADPDDNIDNISVVNGTLVGDNICFTPSYGINEITVVVTDGCGETDSCKAIVTVGRCDYLPGDVNRTSEINGIDITAMIGYFKGGAAPVDTCDCRPEVSEYPFYAAGDVNGTCQFNGVDVTYMKAFFKQYVSELLYCPDCPPTMGWVTVTITSSREAIINKD